MTLRDRYDRAVPRRLDRLGALYSGSAALAMTDQYSKRGASATKEDVHRAIAAHDKGLFPGAFCKVVAEPGQSDLVTIMHADGAGTKSSLAYLVYAETGDSSVFKGIAQDALVMNLDDIETRRRSRRCGPLRKRSRSHSFFSP